MITTAGAPPIFLSPSYVDEATHLAGGLVASSMQALAHRLYQMDPTAYWQGSLGYSDAVEETVDAVFYYGAMQVERTIDTVLLLNNNLENFVVKYSTDGGANWTVLATVTGNHGADYQLFLGSPLTLPAGSVLRVSMLTTWAADQQKKLGNFIAALSSFQLTGTVTPTRPPTKFGGKPAHTVREVSLADGTHDHTYFQWSDNTAVLSDLVFEFDLIPAADKANLDALFASAQPFLVYPEPGDYVGLVYLCLFEPNTYNPGYTAQWKGAGYKFPVTFRQEGYQ